MGLITPAEVPDFFILRNLVSTGAKDANGYPIFKGDRTKVTVQDVIAAEGLRTPKPEQAQKRFNTGIVVIMAPGATAPSRAIVKRASDIRERWIDFWSITTGRRSTMTANPR